MRPSLVTPRTRLTGLLLVVLGLLAACGGAGEGGDGPSISPTRTPTATLPTDSPSIEIPTPTRTRTATLPTPTDSEPTDTPSTPTPTEEPTTPPETESPSETATPTPPPETTSEAAPEPSEEPSAEPTEEASGEQAAEDDGVPPWVWWVVAALVLGCLVAIPLVVRARRRASWRQALERQESEVEWFARSLLPELRVARSHEEMAGGWAVSQRRVSLAEDELTVLGSTAPDEAGRDRARGLRDASRHARARMQQLVAPGQHDTWALDLDTIMIELEGTLRPVAPSTPPG